MRKFANSGNIVARRSAEAENQRLITKSAETGKTISQIRLEEDEEKKRQIEIDKAWALAEAEGRNFRSAPFKPKDARPRLTPNSTEKTAKREPPQFKKLPNTQRWNGERWVKITELERV